MEVPEAGDFQQRSTYVSSISIPQHPVGPTPHSQDSVLLFPYLGLKLFNRSWRIELSLNDCRHFRASRLCCLPGNLAYSRNPSLSLGIPEAVWILESSLISQVSKVTERDRCFSGSSGLLSTTYASRRTSILQSWLRITSPVLRGQCFVRYDQCYNQT